MRISNEVECSHFVKQFQSSLAAIIGLKNVMEYERQVLKQRLKVKPVEHDVSFSAEDYPQLKLLLGMNAMAMGYCRCFLFVMVLCR